MRKLRNKLKYLETASKRANLDHQSYGLTDPNLHLEIF
jgi:hypothetical protein